MKSVRSCDVGITHVVKNVGSIVLLSVILALSSYSRAAAEGEIVWYDYPEEGVVLGQGFNTLEGQPTLGVCVDFVPVQDPSQSISYQFKEVNSTTETLANTSISASGSLQMAIVKATARLSFMSDEKFKRETKKFWLKAEVINSALYAAPSLPLKVAATVPGLGTDAEKYERYKDVRSVDLTANVENVARCGHGYIAAIVGGASVDSFLTFSRDDADAVAEVNGGLEANIAGIFSVSGSFEQRQESHSLQESTQVRTYKVGGAGGAIAYDLAKLKASVGSLTSEAVQNPKPLRIGVIDYSSLDLSPRPMGYTALRFQDAVAAYFLTKDVVDRTSEVIDNFRNRNLFRSAGASPFYHIGNEEIGYYVELNNTALQKMSEISTILSLCRDVASNANKALSAAATDDDNDGDGDGEESSPERVALETRLIGSLGEFGEVEAQYLVQNQSRIPTQRSEFHSHLLRLGSMVDESTRGVSSQPPQIFRDAQSRYDGSVETLSFTAEADVRTLEDASSEVNDEDLQLCNPSNSESPLHTIAQEGIVIALEEISTRPIYWSDLSLPDQHKIATILDRNPATNEEKAQKISPVVQDFVLTYRTTQLQRNICTRNYLHPICKVDLALLKEAGEPIVIPANIDNVQLEKDYQKFRASVKP